MKTATPLRFSFLGIVICLMSGCEATLQFHEEDLKHLITVNALATCQEPMQVFLYESRSFHEPGNWTPERIALKNAQVQMTVNNNAPIVFTYDSLQYCYTSDFKPKEGDVLVLEAQSNGFDPVVSTTPILQSPPFEIVDYSTFYHKLNHDYLGENPDWSGTDTVMTITATFKDPAEIKNYYRLSVRSLGPMGILKAENDSLVKETAVYNVNDLFTSSDMLFQDNNISTAHNGWPAHFSTIFDDAICNGQSYTFTVETRQRQYSKDRPFVVIELQHISEDFYKYLKALEIYNLSANDIYAEPQYIPSNITNGIGIFGSLTATRHTLYF